jgi:hypothetical protein
MIFRWSIWGDHISKNIELLRYSIMSFKKQFGDDHKYIVYTDVQSEVSRYLDNVGADIRQFPKPEDSIFSISSKATWMKWCPTSRLDINQTEFYVDSDVFLLKFPKEIESFLSNQNYGFAIMDEYCGQSWQHGVMARKATDKTPFVNAGLFIQKAGFDITESLIKEFEWWKENIKSEEQTHHDEQGALAIALTKPLQDGQLYVLPKDKYMLIGPNENKDINNLDKVVLFHAVYPDHPAFYIFKNYLDKLLKE